MIIDTRDRGLRYYRGGGLLGCFGLRRGSLRIGLLSICLLRVWCRGSRSRGISGLTNSGVSSNRAVKSLSGRHVDHRYKSLGRIWVCDWCSGLVGDHVRHSSACAMATVQVIVKSHGVLRAQFRDFVFGIMYAPMDRIKILSFQRA